LAQADGLKATAGAALEERIALLAPSRRLRLALAEQAIARFAAGRPIRVLDAGSGDGLLSMVLAKRHPDWALVGVDLRQDLVEAAGRRAADRGLGQLSFQQADLTRPLPVSGFDVVMAVECLSEIPDDRAALAAMAGALAPDGLFVVQVPEENWKPVLKSSAPVWREQVRQGYSAAGLTQALREAGLARIEVAPTYRTTAALAQEVRDRIKGRQLALRAAAFPAMAAAVRLERWGLTGGHPNALFATAHRPRDRVSATI
jgi:trans-aconitate methyltransferase